MRHSTIRGVAALILAGLLAGCGGGGGGGTAPPPVAKSAISGTVSFPSLASLVGKQLPKTAAAGTPLAAPVGTTISAFTIDGRLAGSGTFSNYTTGAFSIQNLTPGVDYVLKAVAPGGAALRRVVERTVVVPNGEASNQNLNEISTAAVTVASQKLSSTLAPTAPQKIILGDPLPQGVSAATVAPKIFEIAPAVLENEIQSARSALQNAVSTNDFSSITRQSLVDLVNVLNIVISAIDNQTDPTKLLTTTAPTITPTNPVTTFTYEGAGSVSSVPITTVTPTVVQEFVTTSTQSYTPPPRVKMEIATSGAPTLHGLTIDITIPAAATGVTESSIAATGSIFAQTQIGAAWDGTNRTMRVVIGSPLGQPLPTGTLLTFNADRTSGSQPTADDFTVTIVKATDGYGQPLTTLPSITKTVTVTGN